MRPKDDDGLPLQAAHLRLSEARMLRQAAYITISADRRACFMEAKRKLAIADKAIDHVFDGGAVPGFVIPGDDHFLPEIWAAAVGAVSAVRDEKKKLG